MVNKVLNIEAKTQNFDTEKYLDISTVSDINKNNSNSLYKISKQINEKAVQNSIHNIFSWIPGERILNPEFGNNLYKYLYEGITPENEELIVAEIKHCILKYEPRVTVVEVQNVSNINNTEDNTIILNIKYYINGLSNQIYDKTIRFDRD